MERANTAALRVGRLLEVRVGAGYRTLADVDALFAAIAEQAMRAPPATRLVFVADWRFCPLMASDAAERMLALMMRNNPRAERSAAIASRASPSAVLQFVRLVRDSQHPDRKLFFDAQEVIAWLSDVLNDRETKRLREFLDET